MSAKSRRKGSVGEREAAGILQDLLGTAVSRNLNQSRDGGHDLLGIDGWAIECKRAAIARLPQWWAQTISQANGKRSALLYRLDRRDWRAVVALADIVPGFEQQPREYPYTVELSLEGFAALLRERVGDIAGP